jgi:cytochrome c
VSLTARALRASLIALVGAAGVIAAQSSPAARLEMNRFTPVTIIQQGELDEPMAFEVLPGGKVYIIERKGALKAYDPATKLTKTIETLPVNTKYSAADGVAKEAEEGLIGITLDPKFATNHFIYLLYAEPAVTKHVLARWTLNEFDELDPDSKKIVLEYGTQREVCCHTGGGMAWDAAGNLIIAVGDNTGVNLTSHTDERPGRINWDDQHTSANTNDLRGKILRIHPEENGGYTIPAGNLFAPGTPLTRPEIFAMGVRNPWRVFVDSKTGWIYWSEVGPDATEDTATTARGYDEFNQAKTPGYFGWPYFIGETGAFPVFDYEAKKPGARKDPAHPVNASPNNTGLRDLPPARPPLIWYPYALSTKFPELGTGARSAMGGPILHRADFPNAKRLFPEYVEGKWVIADLSRGLIMLVSLTADGAYAGMERFLPSYRPIEPIDMKFGPDGDLYVLEYGSNWFRKSDNARLVRIEYNAGNRPPVAKAAANVIGGTVPLKVTLTSKGSVDPDGDALKYSWSVEPEQGGAAKTFTTADASLTFDKNGVYFATLTVTDPAGTTADSLVTIIAGNSPPEITFDVPGNRTFFFPDQPLKYSVTVKDKEDGIAPADRVAFSIDQVSESFDTAWLAQGDAPFDASTRFGVAMALVAQSDCRNCLNVDS